jgi:hypothetical protein
MFAIASPRNDLRRTRLSTETQERLVLATALAWGALIWALAIGDVIAQLPPRPPTPAEIAADRPRAAVKWRVVRTMLEGRLDQRNPLEFGAVWSTRTGVICGLVNGWGSFGGLTGMTRFIAVGDTPAFVEDAPDAKAAHQFNTQWVTCRVDPWIVLHGGSAETGFYATRLGERRCVEAWGLNPISAKSGLSRSAQTMEALSLPSCPEQVRGRRKRAANPPICAPAQSRVSASPAK